ncbi:hypothetical protein SBV1_gp11 [Sulfolobales Beppu virus 1]|nr:hypothetical protein SBV1_gp11 [Sulfolobales Beppu virus 1]
MAKVKIPVQQNTQPQNAPCGQIDPRNELLQSIMKDPTYTRIIVTDGTELDCKFAVYDMATNLYLCYKINEVLGIRKEDVKRIQWVKNIGE